MLQNGREKSKEKGDKKQHEVALNLWMHMKIEQKCISSHSSREQNATKGSTREVYENISLVQTGSLNSILAKSDHKNLIR